MAPPIGQSDELRSWRLQYTGKCVNCGLELSRGANAWWRPSDKKVICLACGPTSGPTVIDEPGRSAIVEGARRKDKKVAAVRQQHGDYAAAVAERTTQHQIDRSWLKGGDGERRLAAFIEREVGDAVIALHDRLRPGTKANIDHIWIASTGVWVVDAKAHTGKVVKRSTGTLWRPDNQVRVAGRDRTALARGVVKQVDTVVAALTGDPTLKGTDVHGVLCFVEADWDLLDFPFQVGSVWVMYPGALRKRLRKRGFLSRASMERIAHRLDLSLPRAG